METIGNETCIAAIDNSDEILLDCDLGRGAGEGETDFGGDAGEGENDLGGGVGDGDDLDTITPKVGMEFPSQDDAYKFYNRYALKLGFGTRWSSTVKSKADPTLVISRRIVCKKEGKKISTVDEELQRRETRVGCKAMMKILRQKSGSWRVCIFCSQHNHELSTPSKTLKHRSHKKIHRQAVVKNLITQLHSEGMSNANITKVVNSLEPDPQHSITGQQVHQHLRVESRRKALASRRKAEEDEDFTSIDTKAVLTLEWQLEDHAAQIYTRALFNIFKDEMKDAKIYWAEKVNKVGTVTTYSVGRPKVERSKYRIVSFDSDGVIVS